MSDGFYKTMYGIFRTGEVVQPEFESALSDRLREPYDMSVILTGFDTLKTGEGLTHGDLCVLIDGRKSRNNTVKSLENLPGAANNGLYLNSSRYGECFRKLADDLLKEYSETPGNEYKDCDEITVSVWDFTAVGINQIYGAGCRDVGRYMNKHYNVRENSIAGSEDSEYIVLIDRLSDFDRIIKHKEKIRSAVFGIMKEYDRFELLEYDELKVSFLLKDSLDHERLSRLLRSCPVETF